jgi:hypothetical protein
VSESSVGPDNGERGGDDVTAGRGGVTDSGADESVFGSGGESSHDSDVEAGYDSGGPEGGAGAALSEGSADGGADDSHAADVDAGYDDQSDSPTVDGSNT